MANGIDNTDRKRRRLRFLQLKRKQSLTRGTAEQRAGPVVEPGSFLKRVSEFRPRAEQIPELVGGTIGALATRTVPGAIFGAGLGSAAGEAGRQLLGRAGLLKTDVPETTAEAARGIAGGLTRGVLAETVGRIAGFPLARKPGTTPEAARLIGTARREGITPPLSARTQSLALERAEAAVERTPFIGEIIRKGKLQALNDFENFANKFNIKLAPKRPESLGNFVSAKLKNFESSFRKTKNQLYDVLPEEVLNSPAQLGETVEALERIVGRRAGTAEPAGLGQFRQWLQEIKPRPRRKDA